MSNNTTWATRARWSMLALAAILVAAMIGAFARSDLPQRLGLIAGDRVSTGSSGSEMTQPDPDSGHDHPGHGESIELSAQARANLDLKTQSVSIQPYTKYIEVPGVVTAWPGQTHFSVTSPLTGVIHAINVSRGELIDSGTPLFTLRLTHQDLVNTQEKFLSQLGQLDVEQKEIRRLSAISSSGAIAGKTRIAREYERDKLLAGIRAARQAMLLHGLTEEQVNQIEATRTLIREVIVFAPIVHEDNSLHHESLGDATNRLANSPSARLASMQPPVMSHPGHLDVEFLVTELEVRRGEAVTAGQQLAQLSDYSRLLIEGHAYQRDSEALRNAADGGGGVQAVFDQSGDQTDTLDDLKIASIGNEIGRDSRSLPFYVSLENQIERSENQGKKRYVSWRYKPGQRLTVRLPVERIENTIVVPKDALAREGLERYLFVENGDHFDRVAVHVLARDSVNVAIANEGQVWPGQTVAISGAHQLQMAIKNRSGGAIDPHAGHNH